MFLDANPPTPDASFYQKTIGGLLAALASCLLIINRMRGKKAQTIGKPVSIDDTVREVVRVLLTEERRYYDGQFARIAEQRASDQRTADKEMAGIIVELSSVHDRLDRISPRG